jgi:hypothetical protein
MDFGDALKAIKEGKKVRRVSNPNVILYKGEIGQFFSTETLPSLIREENGKWEHSDLYGRRELFGDDWEIVEDVPAKTDRKEIHKTFSQLCEKANSQIQNKFDKQDSDIRLLFNRVTFLESRVDVLEIEAKQ